MDWIELLLDVIDFRSFSALWYWIVVAVTWSTASHWVLGVPFDLVLRARRGGGAAMGDLEDLVRIYAGRLLFIARESGLWLAAFATFGITALAMLGFWYGIEFAQAIVLILGPLALVGLLSLNTAARIEAERPDGEALCRMLLRHRVWTQGIGMVSIFVTALFGMFQNLATMQFF